MKGSTPTALVACVLICVSACLAEDTMIRRREVIHGISTALLKRQELSCSDEKLNETLQRFPAECISALKSESEHRYEQQRLSVLCNDSCAQPFYDYSVACFKDRAVITGFEVLCSRNENGQENGSLCYDTDSGLLEDAEAELTDACKDHSCSVFCEELLKISNSETGCCLYTTVAMSTSLKATKRIWASCDVDAPGVCTSRFTGAPIRVSGEATVTSYISVLVASLLIASTSLN